MEWHTQCNRNGILNGTETEYTMEHKWTYKMEQTWEYKKDQKSTYTIEQTWNTQWNRNVIQNGTDGIQNRTEMGIHK